jgi:hypothetical protein
MRQYSVRVIETRLTEVDYIVEARTTAEAVQKVQRGEIIERIELLEPDTVAKVDLLGVPEVQTELDQ